MKAIAYQHSLPIADALSLQDVDLLEPTPLARDLLVEVHAVAVNPVDAKVRLRAAPPAGEWKVLGWDAVGVVLTYIALVGYELWLLDHLTFSAYVS